MELKNNLMNLTVEELFDINGGDDDTNVFYQSAYAVGYTLERTAKTLSKYGFLRSGSIKLKK